MTKPEGYIQNEVRLAASQAGFTLYRNNVGAAWQGEATVKRDKDGNTYVHLVNPRRIKYGLKDGSGDLIGYKPTVITPEMVGITVAIFASVEVKTPTGRVSKKQRAWGDLVQGNGGISIIARSPEDVKA